MVDTGAGAAEGVVSGGAGAVLTIDVPMLPPRELSPNASRRVPMGMQTRLRDEWRRAWAMAAREALYAAGHPLGGTAAYFSGPVLCRLTVYGRSKRAKPWDDDNLHACAKAGRDQLQAVRVVEDDRQIAYVPPRWAVDPRGAGRVLVELWQEDEASALDGEGR